MLQGINDECIDLIYLDPPFNKNKKFTAPIGSSAEGAEFSDIFREEDVKEEWLLTIREDQPELFTFLNGVKGVGNSYNFAYLAYMAIRLIECRRILKPTGSIFLHCDPTMSHYLKLTLDSIFGEDAFRNEIVWCYKRMAAKGQQHFSKCHDIIFWYGEGVKFNVDSVRLPYSESSKARAGYVKTSLGAGSPESGVCELNEGGRFPEDWWEMPFIRPNAKERTGYPTQKPRALLERILKASTDHGDLILDPFCGCATTCIAAENLDRKWIGIDISVKAYELVKLRLEKEVDKPQSDLIKGDTSVTMLTDPPKRTDQDVDHRERKFVYVMSHPAYPGEYKVGIAKNWKSRLNSYQTSDPDRQYQIEFKMETAAFRETESYIHDKFPNKHEWVQGDLKEIVREIEEYIPDVHSDQRSLLDA